MQRKLLQKTERGQVIILVAMAIIGLIAIVGLAVDGGVLFIEYARLKRGIDAAAVAAALQFKQTTTSETQAQFEARLANAALEMLHLNQSDVLTPVIEICARDEDGVPLDATTDPVLCTTVPRKMVRVTASRVVQFGFLPVVGIRQTTVTATSIGEAASVDLVFVIDTSASMSYQTVPDPDLNHDGIPDDGTPTVDPGDDPALCNPSTCEPLTSVKNVAVNFVDQLYFPYDRVAVVASTSQVPDGTRDPVVVQELISNETDVKNALNGVRVIQPFECVIPGGNRPGPCRVIDGTGAYVANTCELCETTHNWESYPSSNIGGSLVLAGNRFVFDNNPAMIDMIREDSLWLVIVIAGGPANASNAQAGLPYGYCPPPTNGEIPEIPFCRDNEWPTKPAGTPVFTRHSLPDPAYDSDDYAYDMADWLAGASIDSDLSDVDGQEAVIFTIGLGDFVREYYAGDPADGEQLLQYMAEDAGDNISPGIVLNHGFYSYTPDTAGLGLIFQRIADNIATRISH
ncbi:MAG: hypothetical protein HZB19_04820 [Chloroflexi bacterium]|nr:hypothetical protein [Chloroflexota bacterium]